MGSAEKSAGRLMGTVVDPAVEAELDAASGPERASGDPGASPPLAPEPLPAPTGHPVRDRLLARAARARALPSPPLPTSPEATAPLPRVAPGPPPRTPGAPLVAAGSSSRSGALPTAEFASTPSSRGRAVSAESAAIVESGPLGLPGFEEELERVARPSGGVPGDRPSLSQRLAPNTVAVLGTFLGAATLTSLFALLMHVAPRGESLTPATLGQGVSELSEGSRAKGTAQESAPVEPVPEPKVPGPWRVRQAALDGEYQLIQGTIGDQPFLRAIQDAGLSKTEAYRVYGALKEHKDLDRCRPKDTFLALLDPKKQRVTAFEYEVSAEEVYQARENDEGALVGKPLDLRVERHRRQAPLIVSADFPSSAQASGFDPSLARVLNQALDGHLTTADLKPGDRFRLITQEVSVLGEFSRYTGVEALEWNRPSAQSSLRLYYFPVSGKRRWVDGKGRAPGEGGWNKPVKGAPITSRFNPKRLHPILKRVQPHTGTDFGAPAGTPVLATREGVVSFLGEAGPNGNFITLEHDASYQSGYSHLLRFAKTLKKGDRVRAKQVIGYVGSTGRSTGPHLHFSVKRKGQFIDPESLKLDALVVLPHGEREAFELIRTKYDRLLDTIALPEVSEQASLTPVSQPESAGDEVSDEDEAPSDDELAAQRAGAPPAGPTTAPVAPNDAPAVSPVRHGSSPQFYLSDQELMRSQPATDADEVDE